MLNTPVENSLLAGRQALRKLYAPLLATVDGMTTPQVLAAMRLLRGSHAELEPHVALTRHQMAALLEQRCSTRADWPAHALQPPMPADGFAWQPHNGGPCPAPPDTIVLVALRNGHVFPPRRAWDWDWTHAAPLNPNNHVLWWRASAPGNPPLPGAAPGLVWLPWYGAQHAPAPPVEPDALVRVQFRGGELAPAKPARNWFWQHDKDFSDVTAWALEPVPNVPPQRWQVWQPVAEYEKDIFPMGIRPSTRVQVRYRSGEVETDVAENYAWWHDGSGTDVVHWRLAP